MTVHRMKYSTAELVIFLPILFAVLLACGILGSSTFSTIGFVAFVELSLLVFAVRLLSSGLPEQLKMSARYNSVRLDGTHSRRRKHFETTAKRKFTTDILALLLIVLFTGNALATAIHCFVIPIPLALAAMTAFDIDRETWKQKIEAQNIDVRYKSSFRDQYGASPGKAEEAATELWQAWPLVLFGVIGWGIGAQVFLVTMYRRALAEYSKGIAHRAKLYAERDVTRLQQEFEPEFNRADAMRSG